MRILAVLLAFCLVEGAQAQRPERPTWQDREVAKRHGAEMRDVVSRYARCVARRRSAEASEFVLGVVGPIERRKAIIERMDDGDCMALAGWDGVLGVNFPLEALRYSLADALVTLEFPANDVVDFSSIPPLPRQRFDPAEYQQSVGKVHLERLRQIQVEADVAFFISALGECVVRSNTVGSHRLLMTEVASANEAVEFDKLETALAGCIPNKQQFSFNKTNIRGAIALNYYLLAKAARGATIPGASQ